MQGLTFSTSCPVGMSCNTLRRSPIYIHSCSYTRGCSAVNLSDFSQKRDSGRESSRWIKWKFESWSLDTHRDHNPKEISLPHPSYSTKMTFGYTVLRVTYCVKQATWSIRKTRQQRCKVLREFPAFLALSKLLLKTETKISHNCMLTQNVTDPEHILLQCFLCCLNVKFEGVFANELHAYDANDYILH